ncbi:hypothetical protein [Chitinophaga qingshengii]|uniref:Pectate lyase superfamily protein domain-containing protein n=1 Tax=Chitinophaga qingshengii TaxID=1569794 RepID=A0ABR7TR17_9BACT|nr:hypothetical protein [Chitinophaga qingshengii]MBC9932926.1 hypothetical protein [Chitinophaga qingshengii]
MHYLSRFSCCLALLLLFNISISQAQECGEAPWVSLDAMGKLSYRTLERGDRIMDFSYAGYGGGGVALPEVPVQVRLQPLPGDNTAAIQAALDQVAALPLVNGFRGAVLLAPGAYVCSEPLVIRAGGVVLRGSGSGENGSILQLSGKPHMGVTVRGESITRTAGPGTVISSSYVPAGSLSFTVTDATGFNPGDTIRITRPVTPEWVRFMGMDSLVRDGKKQTWITGDITTERVITTISGHSITLDVPLPDAYDAAYTKPGGVTVNKITTAGTIRQCGIEQLRIVSPGQSGTINERHHQAFSMSGVTDAWARDISIYNTVNSINVTGKRITLQAVSIFHELSTIGAAKPADLNGSGTQLLFDRCSITGDNVFFLATGAKVTGPIVLLHCTFNGKGWIQPHQRWATGLLADNCTVPDGGIDFMNRGEMGSGHGWAIGWAVAWNCQARSFLNQRPPGAANWVIGSTGEKQQRPMPFEQGPLVPEGIYSSHGKPVQPQSLYLSQLAERLGQAALKHIGY